MTYLVARGDPATVEEVPTLEAALERAGRLVSDNYFGVAIRDGKGNEISGNELLACYLGVKSLTSDLRAVEAHDGSAG
jgi:hypothetical protein